MATFSSVVILSACSNAAPIGCPVPRHLVRLRKLNLKGGIFDDKALRMLTSLTALRWLSLEECSRITDVSLRDVVAPLSLHSLSYVNMQGVDGLPSRSLVSQAQIPPHKSLFQRT